MHIVFGPGEACSHALLTGLHTDLTGYAHQAGLSSALDSKVICGNCAILHACLGGIGDALHCARACHSNAYALTLGIRRCARRHAHHASITGCFHAQSSLLQLTASFVGASTRANSDIFYGGSKIIGNGIHIGRSCCSTADLTTLASYNSQSQSNAYNGIALIAEGDIGLVIGGFVSICAHRRIYINSVSSISIC